MAFLTWLYFTAPMAVMKTATASNVRNIRFFMNPSLPSSTAFLPGRDVSRVFDRDVALLEQPARGARELRLRPAVVRQRGGLGDPGVGQVVLAGQHEEVGRETHLETL